MSHRWSHYRSMTAHIQGRYTLNHNELTEQQQVSAQNVKIWSNEVIGRNGLETLFLSVAQVQEHLHVHLLNVSIKLL